MIKLENGEFKFHRNYVTFKRNGEEDKKFTSDINYWIDFINKWDNHHDLKIFKVIPSKGQQFRLDEVNKDAVRDEGFIGELSLYVEYGACVQEPMTEFMKFRENSDAVVSATLAYNKGTKKDEVRKLKKLKEYGGITFNGMDLRTDEKSQNRVTGMATSMIGDETLQSIDFEVQKGVFVELDRATALSISKAVSDHVQGCFTKSKKLQVAIDGMTTSKDIIDLDLEVEWDNV